MCRCAAWVVDKFLKHVNFPHKFGPYHALIDHILKVNNLFYFRLQNE